MGNVLRPLRAPQTAAATLLIALTVALLTARLLNPPARLVDVGSPGDAYLAVNFYQPEQAGPLSYRWSGPGSFLQLPRLTAQAALLSVRLHGSALGQPVYLRASEASIPVASFSAGQDWRTYQVLLPPLVGAAAPRALQLVTGLVQHGTRDPRELGVAVDWVHIQPLGGVAGLLPAARQSALLGWALALLGVVLLVVQRAWAPAGAVAMHSRRSLALLAVAAAGLLLWAWWDPYGLGWLLPLQPAPLALATVAVGGFALTLTRRGAARLLRGPRAEAVWALTALAAAHLVLWSPVPAAGRGNAALAILWAPGWLIARALTRGEADPAARLLLGVCGALALQVVLLLAGALVPGGLAPWAVVLACDLLALLGAWRLARGRAGGVDSSCGAGAPWGRPRLGVLLALILLLAAGLRLPAIGGAELHDDEASVFIAAARLVQGERDVLLTQLKGPAQVLLPAGPLLLTGQQTELAARLPFALAGLGVVLGGFVLVRSLAGSAAGGLVAALILALDGFMIAFSRIVQYQSVVVVLAMGALWCAWHFAEGEAGRRGHLAAAALLLAVALLGHYDAVFAAPALAWLVFSGGRRRGWRPGQWAAHLALPALAAGGLLASFYVPFALHPHFAEAVAHLSERTGQSRGGLALYNNLASTYGLLSFYNLAAAVQLVGAVLVGGLAASLLRRPRALWQGLVPLLLWCGGGAAATLFLIAQPRTHVYVFTVPLALLAGWCGAQLGARLGGPAARALRFPLAGGVLLVALLALLHQTTLYLRQSPEYQRAYPATALAPLSTGASGVPIDVDARFGFPSRDGWKAVGELYRRGVLAGPYASNQSTEILTWYLRGLRRCGATPDYVFVALAAPNAAIPAGYARFGSVQVAGQDQILIYSRLRQGPPRVFALENYVEAFDAQPVPPLAAGSAACGPAQ